MITIKICDPERWLRRAEKDHEVALFLFEKRHQRNALRMSYWQLEKSLKALICSQTGKYPPRTQDPIRLAEYAKVELSNEERKLARKMYRLSPEFETLQNELPTPPDEIVERYIKETDLLCQKFVSQARGKL